MKRWQWIIAAFLSALTLSACGHVSHVSVGYQPPVVPVRLVVQADGSVSLEGAAEWITPVGTFSIGANYELKEGGGDELFLVLRDRAHQTDEVFKIRRDKFFMSLEGSAQIEASRRKVIIDVTNAQVKTIRFFPRAQVVDLSPEDVVTNYWAYVGSENYHLSWSLLSSGFRNRNHHNEIENYIEGYKALHLCNVEANQVSLVSLENDRAFVNATVIYYKGASCQKYSFKFSHELIKEGGEWKIEHVNFR